MVGNLDVEQAHNALEDGAVPHGASVHVKAQWPAAECQGLFGLRRHGVEQEPQGRLGVLAVGAVVFLIGHAAAVVDNTEEHQRRWPATLLIDPVGALDLLEVRRADVELPQGVAVFGLKTHRRRLAREPLPVQPPALEVAVDRGLGQHALRGPDEALRGIQSVVLEQADRFGRRQMATLLIGGADLDRSNQLAVTNQLGFWKHFGYAAIPALCHVKLPAGAQPAVERTFGDAVESRRLLYDAPTLAATRR